MNIKEIIDAQRWSTLRDIDYGDGEIISNAHNKALILIEAGVRTYVIKLEKQVSTLEKAFIFEGKKYEEHIKDLEAENVRLKADKDELYQTAMEMFYRVRDDMPTWEKILDKHSVRKEAK